MTNEIYYQKLRINPRYRPYVIERDEVVVLYDNKRPLILEGREAGRKDTSGVDPFDMLPRKQMLTEKMIQDVIAYLLSVSVWDEGY